MEGIVAHAAQQCLLNIARFLSNATAAGTANEGLPVLEEGAQFHAAWLETQPMGGAMYATRSAHIALNNILIFMRTQRTDGALPGQTGTNTKGNSLTGDFGSIQGLFFAAPAVDMALFIRLAPGADPSVLDAYLAELAQVLEGYDGWLHSRYDDAR